MSGEKQPAAGIYSYDAVPYPNHPFPQSHPDCLATVATLFGVQPRRIEDCRILEIGCGRGGNLLPMAEQLPRSTLLGIELSAVQIQEAQNIARELELSNIELRHMNILDYGGESEQFDYIIAHGVYSWVPREVQEKILEICATQLAPHGIAYISYNTYPGWNMRGMIRDMMEYHTRQFADPHVRIQQARALLNFLAQNSSETTPYGLLLKGEVQVLRNHHDGYLFHEHLEDVNDPVYFYEFAERAAAHGLQYLGESDIAAMYMGNWPAEVVQTLERVANDLVQMEQYSDFLRNRTFRQTLLCRQSLPLDRELRAKDLETLYVSSPVVQVDAAAERHSSESLQFRHGPSGKTITATSPLMKAMMQCLAESWPARIAFPDLLPRVRSRFDSRAVVATSELEWQTQEVGRVLLKFYVSGLVQLHATPSPCAPRPPAYPQATRLARWQAEQGQLVTNLAHSVCRLDDFELKLLPWLDGTRNCTTLVELLQQWVDRGILSLQPQPTSAGASSRTQLTTALEAALGRFSKLELLLHDDANVSWN